MRELRKAPSAETAVKTYGLTPLEGGLDFALNETGDDLVRTVDGDVQVGNKQQNALQRLLRLWVYNEPTLYANFDFVMYSFSKEASLRAEQEDLGLRRLEETAADRYHEIDASAGTQNVPPAGT